MTTSKATRLMLSGGLLACLAVTAPRLARADNLNPPPWHAWARRT